MYIFFICVILGILLFIFLNTNESLNIGGPDNSRRRLGKLPNEPAPPSNIGDIVSVDNTQGVPGNSQVTAGPPPERITGEPGEPVEDLRIGDQGIVIDERDYTPTRVGDTPVILLTVRIYRPSHNVDVNLYHALRRLALGYAMNPNNLVDSPLRNVPEDLLMEIVIWLNRNFILGGYIGQYLIDARALRTVESPLAILRNMLMPPCVAPR